MQMQRYVWLTPTLEIFNANDERQTIKSFDESIRMYAIPAETASQNMPFKKEELPGPGKSLSLITT